MKTQNYLKELENHIESLDNNTRKNILTEIRTCIEEEKLDYDALLSKFGSVESLADSYLEDIPLEKRVIKKAWYKKKRTYIFSFLVIVFLPEKVDD